MSRQTGTVLGKLDRLFNRGTLTGLGEGQLLERFVEQRDESAFAALVALHGPMVLGVCRRVLRDERDVEDAFQATFLVLVRRATSIRDRERVGHWLHGVAHRVAVRARAHAARRAVHETDLVGDVAADKSTPPALAAERESRAIVQEELAGLPATLRAPVVLCYLEGMTHDEAARTLRWPVGTVRSRMSRARDLLRRRLARRGLIVNGAALAASLAGEPVSAALLDNTVRASLSFMSSTPVATALFSTTAATLARGVIQTMLFSKLKVLGAAVLASVLCLGGASTLARQLGVAGAQERAGANSKNEDRRKNLETAVAKLQAALDESVRKNAEYQKELQALRLEIQALRNSRPTATNTEAQPLKEMLTENTTSKGGRDPQAIPTYFRVGQHIVVIAPDGEKVSVYNPLTKSARSVQLNVPKGVHREVTILSGENLLGLHFPPGPAINRIAVYDFAFEKWHTLDLREPVKKAAASLGKEIVAYHLGRYVYCYSNVAKRWGVLELPGRNSKLIRIAPTNGDNLSLEFNGHIYTFNLGNAKWSELDVRDILKMPDGKAPVEATDYE